MAEKMMLKAQPSGFSAVERDPGRLPAVEMIELAQFLA
jgi:hypothetical protein